MPPPSRPAEPALVSGLCADIDLFIDACPFAVIEWSRDMRVLRWSPEAERVFGWSAAEVLGKRPDEWSFTHPDDSATVKRAIGQAITGSAPTPPVIGRNFTRDGRLLHCEWHNRANRDRQGRLVSLLSFAKDLTRQLEAERARDISEARYAHIFNNSHAVMLILDPESGRILDANPAAEEFYGWSKETLKSMQIGDINTLSPQALLLELKAAHAEERKHFEFRHRRADGSIRDVEVHSGPTEDGNRSVVFSIVHDITERKRAEAISRRWERFFRLSNLGLAMHDVSDNTIIDVNATYASKHGYSIEELRGMNIADLYAEEEREQLRTQLAEADRVGNSSFETVHLRKDGSRLPLVIGITGLQDDSGKTIARFVFALDISARKAAEENLRKLSRAVEESPESIVITNTRAEIEYVNKAFVDKTGYSRAEAIGQNPRLLQSGRTEPEAYRELWDTITHGRSWRGEFFNRCKDGSEYLEKVTITPIHDENGVITHYVALKQDITEQRRMEDELERYREHLEGLVAIRTAELQQALDAANIASRAKTEFLTTMSHEIRTPMNGVIGLLDVLSRSRLSAEQVEMVGIMRKSAETLLRLIDDILDFSKIESGNLELDIGPTSIPDLIARVVGITQTVANRKAVTLSSRIDSDVPPVVHSDALRLQQVLGNLVGNAVKFSSGLDRPGRVEIRVKSAGTGQILFMVTDNGIGIAPEAIEKIFQPFSQAESTTTRRFGGTGLGLSICTRLVRMFKGRIEVSSLPGRGSRFMVTLPLAATNGTALRGEPAQAGEQAAPRPLPRAQAGTADAGRRILVAEDNDINRRVIERQLALLGLECESAENGHQALECWRAGGYGLLLTDLHMPGMDGYELTARIRSEEVPGKRMPIVAVTANALRGERERCIDAGMDDFILKPVQVAMLQDVLGRWLQLDLAGQAPAGAAPDAPADGPPVFDPRTLPALIGDDAALITEFLGEYRESASDSVRSIRQACEDGDWRQAGELAHRLKSSSRSVGALQLGEICAILEQAGRDSDGDRARQLAGQLDTALEVALRAMQVAPDAGSPA
ncbi:PAS domain S-box protein [Thauera sp.]|uniref:PAS domain S-box protein n=1 Tax=Thauera sp. TaxID=1905334 RepID=UPI002B8E6687|nr:PAS domain S-box protein [Thauera sp.]HRO36931.1 PAS domain S-box protein [Thauera sp.]